MRRGLAAASLAVAGTFALVPTVATLVSIFRSPMGAETVFGLVVLVPLYAVLCFTAAFAVAYALGWIVGLPLHYALRRLGLRSWWAYAAAGGAVTVAIALAFDRPPLPLDDLIEGPPALLLAQFVGAGPLAATVFWLVAVHRADRAEAAEPPWFVAPLCCIGGFVVAVAIAAAWMIDGMCGEEVFQTLPSPDGALSAVVYERDCGVTSDANTQVSIVPAGESLDYDAHPSFFSIGDRFEDLDVRWEGPRALTVRIPGGARAHGRGTDAPEGVAVTYVGG